MQRGNTLAMLAANTREYASSRPRLHDRFCRTSITLRLACDCATCQVECPTNHDWWTELLFRSERVTSLGQGSFHLRSRCTVQRGPYELPRTKSSMSRSHQPLRRPDSHYFPTQNAENTRARTSSTSTAPTSVSSSCTADRRCTAAIDIGTWLSAHSERNDASSCAAFVKAD